MTLKELMKLDNDVPTDTLNQVQCHSESKVLYSVRVKTNIYLIFLIMAIWTFCCSQEHRCTHSHSGHIKISLDTKAGQK